MGRQSIIQRGEVGDERWDILIETVLGSLPLSLSLSICLFPYLPIWRAN